MVGAGATTKSRRSPRSSALCLPEEMTATELPLLFVYEFNRGEPPADVCWVNYNYANVHAWVAGFTTTAVSCCPPKP